MIGECLHARKIATHGKWFCADCEAELEQVWKVKSGSKMCGVSGIEVPSSAPVAWEKLTDEQKQKIIKAFAEG